MASVYKTASGWRAQIKKAGIRMSETFPTRAEARAWAAEQETLIEQRRVLSSGKRADFRAVLQRALDELPLSQSDQVRVRQMIRRGDMLRICPWSFVLTVHGSAHMDWQGSPPIGQ